MKTENAKFKLSVQGNNLIYENPNMLSLDLTLDCGQSFRWSKNDDGHWCAVIGSDNGNIKPLFAELEQNESLGPITFYNTTEEEFFSIWVPYLDLDRDYSKICENLSADQNIEEAILEFPGIHILNQDPWETICSFIISQNNNIPRIKGIIDRMCEAFGTPIKGVDGLYSFPSAECIAKLEPEDLSPLRAGFRNKYIIDAARKIATNEVDLIKTKTLPLIEAEEELIKIKGVGSKVAQCALLYGLGHIDGFPIDVWVKRIMAEMYPEGLPKCVKGYEGIAQQYLFHWRRNSIKFN